MTPLNLDTATLELLNDLKNEFSISFETKNIDYCEVFQKNKTATIYYNPKNVNTASIAHELLHVWLKRFNYCVGNHLFLSTEYDKKLSKIFEKFLCDHIGNCFDHIKMYPKFIEMGYNPSEFLMDSIAEKASIKVVKGIRIKFLGLYNSKAINLYIGSLISILADHMPHNYTEHHKILYKKNEVLYKIITEYWAKWVVFDIKNIDAVYNSDLEITDNLVEEFTKWAELKTIY